MAPLCPQDQYVEGLFNEGQRFVENPDEFIESFIFQA